MVGGCHYCILQGEMDEQETNRFSILLGDPKQASSGVAMSLEFQSLEHPFFPHAQFLSIGRA